MTGELDLHKNPGVAAEMAANSVLYYLNGLDLEDPMEKHRWVRSVFDMVFSKLDPLPSVN